MRVGDPSPAARWRGVFPAKVRAFTLAWSCRAQAVTSMVELAKPFPHAASSFRILPQSHPFHNPHSHLGDQMGDQPQLLHLCG